MVTAAAFTHIRTKRKRMHMRIYSDRHSTNESLKGAFLTEEVRLSNYCRSIRFGVFEGHGARKQGEEVERHQRGQVELRSRSRLGEDQHSAQDELLQIGPEQGHTCISSRQVDLDNSRTDPKCSQTLTYTSSNQKKFAS